MSRACACVAVAACLMLAGPARAQTPTDLETRTVFNLLAEPIETKDFVTPMSLKDAIGLLNEKFAARKMDFPILVNLAAYRTGTEIENPLEMQVKLPSVPRQLSARLALEHLVGQIPEPSTYVVRQGHVEILPTRVATMRAMLQRPVIASYEGIPLRAALNDLAAQTGATINLDERGDDKAKKAVVSGTFRNNATLQDAIVVLANQAGMRMVVLQNSVYVTTPDNAAQVERDIPPAPITTTTTK